METSARNIASTWEEKAASYSGFMKQQRPPPAAHVELQILAFQFGFCIPSSPQVD